MIPRPLARLALALSLLPACGDASAPAPSTPASPASPAPPTAPAATTAPPSAAAIDDAKKTVMALQPDLRKCWMDGIASTPQILEGSVVVATKIDATGAVTSATPDGTPDLPADIVACITSRIQRAQFPSLGPSGTTLRIPLRFKRNP